MRLQGAHAAFGLKFLNARGKGGTFGRLRSAQARVSNFDNLNRRAERCFSQYGMT